MGLVTPLILSSVICGGRYIDTYTGHLTAGRGRITHPFTQSLFTPAIWRLEGVASLTHSLNPYLQRPSDSWKGPHHSLIHSIPIYNDHQTAERGRITHSFTQSLFTTTIRQLKGAASLTHSLNPYLLIHSQSPVADARFLKRAFQPAWQIEGGGQPLYWGWLELFGNIFVWKMGKINKWPQSMVEIRPILRWKK